MWYCLISTQLKSLPKHNLLTSGAKKISKQTKNTKKKTKKHPPFSNTGMITLQLWNKSINKMQVRSIIPSVSTSNQTKASILPRPVLLQSNGQLPSSQSSATCENHVLFILTSGPCCLGSLLPSLLKSVPKSSVSIDFPGSRSNRRDKSFAMLM